jgi:hypothetical protein
MITVEALVAQGLDPILAASLVKKATDLDNKPAKKRFIPADAINKPKKCKGLLTVTQICATCGGKDTHRIFTLLDPRHPQATTVYTSICTGCITMYRTMDHEALISLIVLKDHPDPTMRRLENHQQIKLARKERAEVLLNLRSDVAPAPDNRYLKPEYD